MRKYGKWAGNRHGVPEDPERCIWSVYSSDCSRGMIDHQCRNRRGHGPSGLFCGVHAKKVNVNEDGSFSNWNIPDEE